MAALGNYRGRLFLKYVLLFAILVSGALLTSGLVQLYFAYQDTQSAVVSLQRGTAESAATKIRQYIEESERQTGWVLPVSTAAGSVTLEDQRIDYLKLLRQAPLVRQIVYLDASGRVQLGESELRLEPGGDQRGLEVAFREARLNSTYYGPVYFRNGTEPYMTIAKADPEAGGVNVAEV